MTAGTAVRTNAPGHERAELLDLLKQQGILRRTSTQPVLSRDGSSARWMLDSLCVSLTPRGAELASRCLLRLLERFEGTQLATLGLTGVPLLQGCILRGGGRYKGVLVRKERKAHGSLKLIEGVLDLSEPVVVVDDSVSSGQTMEECTARLEKAGFHVEGGVCLVRFDYGRGTAKMIERGYRMEAVFDIYEDFLRHMEGEPPYPSNPTKDFGDLVPSPRRGREGMHPAELARDAIAEYLATTRVLRAPAALNRSYDGAGGCWVSLRRRADVHDRPARSGFWHFPDEERSTAAEDVVLASVRAAGELARTQTDPARTLGDCAVAVTFFSALEECTVGELDNDRYGIVVRSRERPPWMGGALPRMPGIANEWEQFFHASGRNARLHPLEPYTLFRHDVEKVVEPGATWQPTGTPLSSGRPWTADPARVGPLARQARRWVLAELGGTPSRARREQTLAAGLPHPLDLAFVTVFANGRLCGCVGGPAGDLDAALRTYAVAAAGDTRFTPAQEGDEIAVSVSLLFNRHEMGAAPPEWAIGPTRAAEQVLEVSQGDRNGLLLPFVAVMNNLTLLEYAYEVIDKAGITRPPYHWTRYDCTTWLASGQGVRRLRNALPEGVAARAAEAELERLRKLFVGYTRRHHVARGDPAARYEVFADRLRIGLVPARLAYGAWVKARAGLRSEAGDDVRRLDRARRRDGWIRLDNHPPTVSELAFLLLARLELGERDPNSVQIASQLWGQVDHHGRIATHRDAAAADPAYQDYAPGHVLLALAWAAERGVCEVRPEVLARALRYYRMRFRQGHHWGAATWLMLAFTAWGRVDEDPALTSFAYEVADWILPFQSQKTGGILNDHQPDAPGATTAVYLEGLAAVWAAARREGDRRRQQRYRSACERALLFLDELVYQRRDTVVLPNPSWAIGGLRTSRTTSHVRIDHVHHGLSAVLSLRAAIKEG